MTDDVKKTDEQVNSEAVEPKKEEVKAEEPKAEAPKASADAKAVADKEVKTSKKVSGNVEKLVDEIAKLSVMELSDLVNALQDKLGVSAAAPMAAPASNAASAGESTSAAQPASGGAQTVVMTGSGATKIAVIKALREINQNLGLKEAKDATENVPFEVMKDAKADDAKSAVEKLKAAGATVEVK